MLVTNMVGEYMPIAESAMERLVVLTKHRLLIDPGWFVAAFEHVKNKRDFVPINTSSALFSPGSADGHFQSTINQSKWSITQAAGRNSEHKRITHTSAINLVKNLTKDIRFESASK